MLRRGELIGHGKNILSYSELVQTGSVHNTALYTHSPQGRVEEPHKRTTIQENHDWYHVNGKGISRPIIGTTKKISLRRCLSHIART